MGALRTWSSVGGQYGVLGGQGGVQAGLGTGRCVRVNHARAGLLTTLVAGSSCVLWIVCCTIVVIVVTCVFLMTAKNGAIIVSTDAIHMQLSTHRTGTSTSTQPIYLHVVQPQCNNVSSLFVAATCRNTIAFINNNPSTNLSVCAQHRRHTVCSHCRLCTAAYCAV